MYRSIMSWITTNTSLRNVPLIFYMAVLEISGDTRWTNFESHRAFRDFVTAALAARGPLGAGFKTLWNGTATDLFLQRYATRSRELGNLLQAVVRDVEEEFGAEVKPMLANPRKTYVDAIERSMSLSDMTDYDNSALLLATYHVAHQIVDIDGLHNLQLAVLLGMAEQTTVDGGLVAGLIYPLADLDRRKITIDVAYEWRQAHAQPDVEHLQSLYAYTILPACRGKFIAAAGLTQRPASPEPPAARDTESAASSTRAGDVLGGNDPPGAPGGNDPPGAPGGNDPPGAPGGNDPPGNHTPANAPSVADSGDTSGANGHAENDDSDFTSSDDDDDDDDAAADDDDNKRRDTPNGSAYRRASDRADSSRPRDREAGRSRTPPKHRSRYYVGDGRGNRSRHNGWSRRGTPYQRGRGAWRSRKQGNASRARQDDVSRYPTYEDYLRAWHNGDTARDRSHKEHPHVYNDEHAALAANAPFTYYYPATQHGYS